METSRCAHASKIVIYGSNFPVWYNSSLKKVLKEKYKYFIKYKKYNYIGDYVTYTLLRKRATKIEDEYYQSYIARVENYVIVYHCMFWGYVKLLNKSSHALPSVMNQESAYADTGKTFCNLFSQYFQSTFLDASVSGSVLYSDISDYQHP